MATHISRCEKNFRLKDCRAKCPTSLLRKSRKWTAAHSSRGRAQPLQKIGSRARDRRSCSGGARLGRAYESEPRAETPPIDSCREKAFFGYRLIELFDDT